ncbi:MAG TPA: ABC transporter substrate-binding protein [Thermoleophilaceae bacterium]|nr:ABC transporter substrate-binding protein [Thermoleophilaceae bacterium]
MNRVSRIVVSVLVVALAAFSVAACGSKDKSSGSGGSSSGGIKTGPGVTGKTITLGVLTDLSATFAPLAQPLTKANQLFWKERNAAGGVCGRTVNLIVKDHGYDPQKAVVQYRDMAPKVAGLNQLLGSPITAALLPTLKSDSMISLLSAWPSSLLGNDFVVEIGAPYDIELINGLDYIKGKGMIKSGDKIGHLYFEGEYGENGLKGSKAFASKNGMKVVEQKIQPTDEDMSGQVAAFKRAGVKAIAVTTGPKQLASLAGIAAAQGLNVPIVGNNPTFDPAVMASPAAKALAANAYVVGSISPWTVGAPQVKKVGDDFVKSYGKKDAKASVQFGYVQSQVMYEILNQACKDKDLSRQGLVKASHELSGIGTGGLVAGKLDYTQVGEPSTRSVYIARPANVTGGLKPLAGTFESDQAKSYDVGASS